MYIYIVCIYIHIYIYSGEINMCFSLHSELQSCGGRISNYGDLAQKTGDSLPENLDIAMVFIPCCSDLPHKKGCEHMKLMM